MVERRLRRAGALAGLATAAACSTGNLTYSEVVRDLDAIVRPEGSGDERRLVYLRNVQQAPGCARWLLLQPFKPLLLLIVGSTTAVELENPSGQVRDLATELAPKAGDSLVRGAATVLRLARVAELDPSSLNRIVALNGLWEIAQVQGLDVFHGLEQGEPAAGDTAQLGRWVAVARTSVPQVRAPVGAPLAPEAAAAYREAMAGLTAQPLRPAEDRLWLVEWLGTALEAERDPELAEATASALRRGMQHAVQWTIAHALQLRAPMWIDVRTRALEILREAGGADGVPLLLALMPDITGTGVGIREVDLWLQLRLIHMCGQLDKERALRKVRLAGQVAQAPIEFLARIALDDSFLLPSRLPALEAMALLLRREHLALEGEGEGSEGEWVRKWYDEYPAVLMNTRWLDARIGYDGSQLRAHWILAQTGLCGDALVAFRGPCAVARAEIADLADVDGPGIAGDDMVHFVWEMFAAPDLLLAVHRQRLLAAQAGELLRELAPAAPLRRDGDDLWVGQGKLSISIATVTPVSSLVHFAVNATPGGAPVRTATLQELRIEPRAFAQSLLQRAAAEQESIEQARAKVRSKGEWRS